MGIETRVKCDYNASYNGRCYSSAVSVAEAEKNGWFQVKVLSTATSVVVQRFDQGENPVEIASYPRTLPIEEQTEETQTETARLADAAEVSVDLAVYERVTRGVS